MKLTSKDRKAIPKSEFGLPGSKKYPVNDKAHAANAKARATQMVNEGKLSSASKAKIDAKANKVLDKKSKPKIETMHAGSGRKNNLTYDDMDD